MGYNETRFGRAYLLGRDEYVDGKHRIKNIPLIDLMDDLGFIPDGKDVGDVAVAGLKTTLITTVKQQAAGILQDTDWYITRKADAGTAVPSAITTHRAAVRTKCASMETSITNAADTPALETLYTYTKQEDGSVTRPLGELPTLEI